MGEYVVHSDELYHHGVKGMKWGVRKKITPNRKKLMVRESTKAATNDENTARKALQRFIDRGNEWVANHHALYATMEANRIANNTAMDAHRIANNTAMDAHRIATNAGLMSMSLGASMGTNPFMFGMI